MTSGVGTCCNAVRAVTANLTLWAMASEADQESNGFFLAFQIFSLRGSLKRLKAYHEASTAAKDAGNGSALVLLCQGGLLFGAGKLVRTLGDALRGPTNRTSIALEEAVSFMRLAVECAANGMICQSLPCAELYVGIISSWAPLRRRGRAAACGAARSPRVARRVG